MGQIDTGQIDTGHAHSRSRPRRKCGWGRPGPAHLADTRRVGGAQERPRAEAVLPRDLYGILTFTPLLWG